MKSPVLALCPGDPHWTPPDDKHLIDFLQTVQLIGKPLKQTMHYLAGDNFLDLIAFMGCSPDINLEPGEDKRPFCHVRLQAHTPDIEFHCGDHSNIPRCPNCRSPVKNWQNRINSWLQGNTEALWKCATCHSQSAPWNYNWRKSAGFGRCFIEIMNIFPKEAIPQQHLLDTLHSHYGLKWHYFYQY